MRVRSIAALVTFCPSTVVSTSPGLSLPSAGAPAFTSPTESVVFEGKPSSCSAAVVASSCDWCISRVF